MTALTYYWVKGHVHRVQFDRLAEPDRRWFVRHDGIHAVSIHLADWLAGDERFSNIRWYSEASWSGDHEWRRLPW